MALAHWTTAAPYPLAGKQDTCPPPVVGEAPGDERVACVAAGESAGVPVLALPSVTARQGPAPAPPIQASDAEAPDKNSRATIPSRPMPPIHVNILPGDIGMETPP